MQVTVLGVCVYLCTRQLPDFLLVWRSQILSHEEERVWSAKNQQVVQGEHYNIIIFHYKHVPVSSTREAAITKLLTLKFHGQLRGSDDNSQCSHSAGQLSSLRERISFLCTFHVNVTSDWRYQIFGYYAQLGFI